MSRASALPRFPRGMAGQISLLVLAVTVAVNLVATLAFHFLGEHREGPPPEMFARHVAEMTAALDAVPPAERAALATALPGAALVPCDSAAGERRGDDRKGPMAITVTLAGGDCARIVDRPPPGPPPHGPPIPFGLPPLVIILVSAAAMISALSIWATRRVIQPLARLADAADRIGQDGAAPPLALTGSSEVRRAAQAFNAMQERLARFVDLRTRMLAAISHDYRTVLTRLRLRSEGIADTDLRARLTRDFDLMEAMVDSALAFARDSSREEALEWVDLTSLLDGLCDGFCDLGHKVTLEAPAHHRLRVRPLALERAIGNLMGNAVKYGMAVRVALEAGPEGSIIRIEDDGPGIPESEMARVFEPFYRGDKARGVDAKGVGLGLSIAEAVIRGHGGEIGLRNRSPRGLVATVELPHL